MKLHYTYHLLLLIMLITCITEKSLCQHVQQYMRSNLSWITLNTQSPQSEWDQAILWDDFTDDVTMDYNFTVDLPSSLSATTCVNDLDDVTDEWWVATQYYLYFSAGSPGIPIHFSDDANDFASPHSPASTSGYTDIAVQQSTTRILESADPSASSFTQTQLLFNNTTNFSSAGFSWKHTAPSSPPNGAKEIHFKYILFHEMGHTIGVGHCNTNSHVMYGNRIEYAYFDDLTTDDSNAAKFLYLYGDPYTLGTGINDHIDNKVISFKLNNNYPNPFNMETNIEFSIQNSSLVNITIYNTLGQLVKTIVNENKPAGEYAAKWDGKNESGNIVSSGIYYYFLQASSNPANGGQIFSDMKKMILIK